ncbi:MAG: hypothetical protein LKJ49_08775 [Olsenella sp.]|jgi:hypothetical protein|nr:hypothetical protein [Olsenella sp.]
MTSLQNELAHATIALGSTITAAMDDVPGFVPCGTPAQVVTDALRAASAPKEPAGISEQIDQVRGFVEHVAGHRAVPAHEGADPSALSADGSRLLDVLFGFASSPLASEPSPQQTEWLYRSLGALESGSDDAIRAMLDAEPKA